ncbi:alcohol dehydrogenase catalytic domain-containing protein [Burkholderia sp. WSM2230]|uniref:alcohol dehydrogenase catalytic domain-containing protein n=1 Tax=Burkholderia sp. WSM2230 TaxID=944435 RepID=UPI0003F855AD|nr:alcohol dehydrogenase catalytic domain-containing protein [Burkholderia sp. WSM2230]
MYKPMCCSMLGVQLAHPGEVVLTDVPRPTPGPNEVLLRVLAAGICQTDLHIRAATDSRTPDGTTLGHEIAGVIEECGDGVTQWKTGERVVVHTCWSCKTCSACLAGRQNACRKTPRLDIPHCPGVTKNGGMTHYVTVPSDTIMSFGDLDPAIAATLTDAGLTPYHAIRTCSDLLHPGSTTVVIGVGGLGNLAAQILRAISATRIVAVDISDAALEAVSPWADVKLRADSPTFIDDVLSLTEGCGADVVIDFVGNDKSLRQAGLIVGRYGAIRSVGLNGGTLPFVSRSAGNPLPRGVTLMCPQGGTYSDLAAVIALAQSGAIRPLVTRYPLRDAIKAFDALEAGTVRGRAVLIPEEEPAA